MSDDGYKEVRWIRMHRDPLSRELQKRTAVAIVENGVVRVEEELFDKMMFDLGFVKEVDQ